MLNYVDHEAAAAAIPKSGASERPRHLLPSLEGEQEEGRADHGDLGSITVGSMMRYSFSPRGERERERERPKPNCGYGVFRLLRDLRPKHRIARGDPVRIQIMHTPV